MIQDTICNKKPIYLSSDVSYKMMQSLESEGKLHKCPSCNLSYSRKYYLNRHIKTAHLRFLTTQIVCEICQVKFSRKEHLNRHTRNKHNPKLMNSVTKESKSSISDTLFKNKAGSIFTPGSEYSFDRIQSDIDKGAIIKAEQFGEGRESDPLRCSSPLNSGNVSRKKYKEVIIKEEPFTERNSNRSNAFDSANITSDANSDNWDDNLSYASMINKKLDNLTSTAEYLSGSLKSENYKEVLAKIDSSTESRNGTCWSPFDGANVPSDDNTDSWVVDSKINRNDSLISEELPTIKLIRTKVKNDPERAYRCTVCKMSYCRKYHLDRHIRSVHAKAPHKCHMCPSKFTRNDHLSRHLKKMHDVVLNRLLKCYQCSESFETKDERSSHYKLTHLRCPYCHKCFTKSDHLTRHIRLVHKMTGEMHQCGHCLAAFVRKDNLLKHTQKQHPELQEDLKALGFLKHSIFDVSS